MKSIFKILAIITIAIFISACVSSGNKKLATMDHDKLHKMFAEGKTTKKDIEHAFGQPSDVDFDNNGNEKWVYEHVRSESKAINFVPIAGLFSQGTNDTKKKLVIIFNKDGSVKKHVFSASKGETNVGMFD
jgi:outer membrane protein assembly factor BamE (lipoprotein component of BamABCDE complex)